MRKGILAYFLFGFLIFSLGTAWASSSAVVKIGDAIILGRIVTVCTGATTTESGTMLINALNSIMDATASKPYLIKIGPGVYNVGSQNVRMQEYIDIEGSGEVITKITGNPDSGGVVCGADNSELRSLTVEHTGGTTNAWAIWNYNVSPKIANVVAIATGGLTYNYGVSNFGALAAPQMINVTSVATDGLEYNFGVSNHTYASPYMQNVTAQASGGQFSHGIRNYNSASATLINVTAKGSGGLVTNVGMSNHGDEGTITAKNSIFAGTTYSLQNDPQFNLYIASSELNGPVNTDGNWNCVSCYNGNYSGLNSSCR